MKKGNYRSFLKTTVNTVLRIALCVEFIIKGALDKELTCCGNKMQSVCVKIIPKN